ncbi:cytochrome ubiquinol oxidase subunit I [Alkalilimnicola ehrlichii MLHE-1]|uniref:Cytochrome bd quinol oxidase subunit 1 apoprotein n=1 Tax=Alkalilimnicola ehrlichii (strain ATCC BAA-1101 / DSM 17681 / MLHE-1) TaxID=187272 RepID=Q0A700_ALKEH|nr:cytochrome ubiquinol oxidase subunit I [Alkalilimnicola ehrlichii]ABI57387.1 cytochrome bd quinol oxidase subunit 1 apoprotein [Alkalilimnicola ehrlichii MLHE-1]
MELDPVFLSRLQFGFVVSFHAIFPVFTIGLASYIAALEGLLYRTGNPVYERLAKFWTQVFAVVFGMGVVSGIVMSFQFGTNWSAFSYASANFLGPILSYEVITAFFLEAVFLGILLFGRNKVPRGTHLFAACMVAIGTFISSFWILSANSWMQTPAGVELQGGVFQITSWMEAIFNPSFWPRFFHMALASFLTAGFVVAGVSAWYLLRDRAVVESRKALGMTLVLLAIVAPAQLVVGDIHGLNTFEHQPEKVAAMEGTWETQSGAPLLLFAIPSMEQERNFMEIGIPYGASLILTHSLDGEVHGLKDWAPEDRPNMPIVFWAFRIMVGIGLLMIVMALVGAWKQWRGTLWESEKLLRGFSWMIPAPFLAVLSGWFVTEVGRMPWVVHGIMRYEEAVSPSLTGGMALFSLIGYVAVYAVVFSAGVYYVTRVVRKGPEAIEVETPSEGGHPKRPMSAAGTTFDDEMPQPSGR